MLNGQVFSSLLPFPAHQYRPHFRFESNFPIDNLLPTTAATAVGVALTCHKTEHSPILPVGIILAVSAAAWCVNKMFTNNNALIIRKYTLVHTKNHELSPDWNLDLRATSKTMADITRPFPRITKVTYQDHLLKPRPRDTSIGGFFRAIWDMSDGNFQSYPLIDCPCRLNFVKCFCTKDAIVVEEVIHQSFGEFLVSLELLTEILECNPPSRDKSLTDIRISCLSTAKRTHFINLNRYAAYKAVVSMTVEFASVIIQQQMNQLNQCFPVVDNTAANLSFWDGINSTPLRDETYNISSPFSQ